MRIVVIDDEPALARNIGLLLTRSGHTVTTFTDPREALAALTDEIDLVISDIDMPHRSGFEVAAQVAARLGTAPPRTLLMSGCSFRDALEAAPKKEVIGTLMKPFNLEVFSRTVQLLKHSRNKCPCGIKLEIACPESRRAGEAENRDWVSTYCHSETYSKCPKYESECGVKLRNWILEGKN